MRRSPSPGPMLLGALITCECGWQGVDVDRAGVLLLWEEHAIRARHDMLTTDHTEQE